MKKNLQFTLLLTVTVFSIWTTSGEAQNREAPNTPRGRARAADDSSKLETKVYRVKDFVLPTPNYAFRGIDLPSTEPSSGKASVIPMGGMGGGMGGGKGGAGAGGFFSVKDKFLGQMGGGGFGGAGGANFVGMGFPQTPGVNEFQITMDDLIETITSTIAPDSWEDVGGKGSVATLGGLLVIQQTKGVHEEIVKLLEALAMQGAAPKSMTIYAYWLSLDGNNVEVLKNAKNVRVLTENNKNVLARGQISCFDGQTVHIVAGNLKSGIISMTPVVGQIESSSKEMLAKKNVDRPAAVVRSNADQSSSTKPVTYLAQFEEQKYENPGSVLGNSRAVGYRPETKAINVGAMLQVTPVLSNSANSVALDIHSIVVSPPTTDEAPNAAKGLSLDRINVNAQQFRTTLQIPINQLRIVGGMTLQPTTDKNDQQLYLLLEVAPEK